jgi:hypothetical protein
LQYPPANPICQHLAGRQTLPESAAIGIVQFEIKKEIWVGSGFSGFGLFAI